MSSGFSRERICHRLQMMAAALSCLVLTGWIGAQEAPGAAEPAPTELSVGESESRSSVVELTAQDWGEDYQVKVKGGDPYTRVRFSVFIDEFRDDFRWLLFHLRLEDPPGERSRWIVPIEVTLWGTFRDVHKGEDVRTTVELRPDNKFSIKVEVKLHDRFDEDAFCLDLLRALLIEQILVPYTGSPGDFSLTEVKPPEWIVHGFDQLIRHRRGGSPSSFYRGFLESGQLLKPAEIFGLSDAGELDPVRHAIFRASSSAMVEALLDQPEGDLGMRGLLGDLGQAAPPAIDVLLRQHFPGFREMDQGLEKWWALELASLGQHQIFEYLDREETERLLTEALTLRFDAKPVANPVKAAEKRGFFDFLKPKESAPPPAPEAFVGTIDQFDQYLDRPAAKDKLATAYDRLQSLKRVGFPLFRPVFAAYERAILRLAKRDTKELAAEFAAITEMRTKIGETLMRSDDYLNHFEATRTPRRSDVFDDYLKVRRALDESPPPKRHDPITRHLDALEWEFR